MRFELSKTPPPHLNRRLQLRMLGFVALIGVLMFAFSMYQARQRTPEEKRADFPRSADPSIFEVRQDSLKDEEFFSPPGDALGEADPSHPDRMLPAPAPAAGDARVPSPAEDGLDQEIARLETQFDKSVLRRVKDNTIGIRSDEADAYYRLLDHARQVSATALEKAGATDVQYLNLMTEPDRFRGEPVTIHGDLWRLYEFQAGPNEQGFKTLYEGWVFTGDSANHPYRIVCSSLPRGLEPGENLRRPVRVTGYFFKREGYASSGGMHVAPTLLARRILTFRPPNTAPPTEAIVPYMIGLVSAVGLAFLVTLVSFAISDRRSARAAMLRDLNAPAPSFAGLDVGPQPTVEESLRQIEAQEWQALADSTNEGYEAVAATLHARDLAAGSPPPRSTTSEVNAAEESDERLRSEARAIREWNARHGSHHSSQSSSEQAAGRSELNDHVADDATSGQIVAATDRELTPEQRAAQEELDRDQAARDRELADRLQYERAQLERQTDSESEPFENADRKERPPERSVFDRARRTRDRDPR